MKRNIVFVLALICVFSLSLSVNAEEVLRLSFDNGEMLEVVTNTLSEGKNAAYDEGIDGKCLLLDKSYGIKLGEVNEVFSVSALVKITSQGGTDTVFFKNMGDAANQKWTGVLSNSGKPSFWTHGENFRWTTVAGSDEQLLGNWAHVCYVEENAVGALYVNGALIGEGKVEAGAGCLYLGATYWSGDAPSGFVDDVKLYNTKLTKDEIVSDFEQYIKDLINIPSEVVGDIELPDKIGAVEIVWQSSDESIVTTDGGVTRGEEDKIVTLMALVDGEVIGEFEVTVLKKPFMVNKEVILSYRFDENDGEIVHDVSGNGNHGAAFGNLVYGEEGAVFDGVDDYIQMPKGVLNGDDSITIVMKMKPSKAQEHTFAFGFGNSSNTGYIFLNPSRPDTNALWFAGTDSDYRNERAISSVPGLRKDEWAVVCIAVNEKNASMYVDGELVMDGYMGVTVSDLGECTANYIAKSLYEGDPYFGGVVEEFTVYGYTMSKKDLAKYKKDVEYLTTADEEYITNVNFENGIEVEVDTYMRNDVKIGAVVLDEAGEVTEFTVVEPDEEIILSKEGTICVFAYNEEDNAPGRIFVKGQGEGFSYEYTPGKVGIVCDKDYKNGIVIIAGYDKSGTLCGVSLKICDIIAGEKTELSGEFDNSVTFKMMYWEDLVSMMPIE